MAAFKPAALLTQAQYDALEHAGCTDDSLSVLNSAIEVYNTVELRKHKVAELLTNNGCVDIDEFLVLCAEQKIKLRAGKK